MKQGDPMQTTICFPDEVAERIRKRSRPFGGSIPSYAATLASDMSALPIEEELEVRELIDSKLRRLGKKQPNLDNETTPAIPNR